MQTLTREHQLSGFENKEQVPNDHDHTLYVTGGNAGETSRIHDEHDHHGHSHENLSHERPVSNWRLATMATLHCLLGCGIGEIVGVIIGTAIGLGMWETMALAMTLGFVFGFALGVIPLLRAGYGMRQAFHMILVSEGLSILVMETAEALTQIFVPGVMQAGLTDGLFWAGMLLALIAGFVAAFPVNLILIGRGIRHAH